MICPVESTSCWRFQVVLGCFFLAGFHQARAQDKIKPDQIEAFLFTPSGFAKEGKPAIAVDNAGRLKIVVRDGRTGRPTCCRVNVVGADGNYYQPPFNDLSPFALTGKWPKIGRGNREGKAPIRYYGRFFYSRGETTLDVPAGPVRVEVWKGIEYRPQTLSTVVVQGRSHQVELTLTPSLVMTQLGYYSGDPHLHFRRETKEDDERILDLLEAEDVRFGSILAFNDPPGAYAGFMERMDTPQFRGLGQGSVHQRGGYQIISGQEYRSSTYGHMNLYLRDELVLKDAAANANDWPLYGDLARETKKKGGHAFYAHGGYAQAIYADVVQGNIDAVELLQFGIYRGIGLEDWYHILNAGYRFPCFGASDYPPCRKLADCITYVYQDKTPTFAQWLHGVAEGRSFVTTGPLLLLEVDGHKPGAVLSIPTEGKGAKKPVTVLAKVRVLSEVAPATNLQLIVGGKVVHELVVPADQGKGNWLELQHPIELQASSWIAARAFSRSHFGEPDAESHTNPVYLYLDGKRPFASDAADALIKRIEGQMAQHRKRDFPEKLRVLDYFERSRDLLRQMKKEMSAQPASGGFDPSTRLHSDEELREFLKPVPPKTPAEALKTFETVGGFRMELVAAEPLVYDPVAAAFDENGKLYVAEMRDYPYLPPPGRKPLGSIRLLEDTDGDGRFDKSTVFADGLLWAAGIAPWKGGVFVAAPPDIWYLKDTDGDGKADVRSKIFTGFGIQNQQGMLNNLVHGLDHKIYGATSVNGGNVTRAGNDPKVPDIRVDGRDFRFDPVNGAFETITGTVQFGNTFDDWDHRFLCSESRPLLHAVLPQHYLERNPFLPVPQAIHNLAPGAVPIFRISPLERWRIIRSARRITHGERPATSPGVSHYVIDAAAGVTVYRGGAYPREYYGNVFVGDGQNNLIHRRVLVPDGPTFKSLRVDDQTEIVRSSDNWFRPVNFVNAPDGTLYVLDMSREILEAIHIPSDVVKHLDLTSGRDYGRIYRLAPPLFKTPPPPRLGQASGAELVAALESPHGWWRDTAHRLIYERQDRSLTEQLRHLLRQSKLPQARLHALWSLHGLGTLEESDILVGLADTIPQIRVHAIRLAEPRVNESARLRALLLTLANDPDREVRFQVAFTLGQVKDLRAVAALAQLARQDADNPWMRTAILSSATETSQALFTELIADQKVTASATGVSLLEQLALVVGARHRLAEVQGILDALWRRAGVDREVQIRLVLSLGDGLKRAGARLPLTSNNNHPGAQLVAKLLTEARQIAHDAKAPQPRRLQAIRLLGCFPLAQTRTVLAGLLDPGQPQPLQVAAVNMLGENNDADIAPLLLKDWRQSLPAVRAAILHALLGRENWTLTLLEAASQGQATLTEIDPIRRDMLLKHRNVAISKLAHKLLGSDKIGARKEVLAAYQSALKLNGDGKRGQAVFRKHCLVCHQLGQEGFAVGPDLTASATREPAAMLVHILDPNQYVLPNYVQYYLVDKSGRTFAGLIASETATSITLKGEKNEQHTILRNSIEELTSTGKSLMPEGFEKQLGQQDLADLLAFLSALPPSSAPRLDIGTKPGLVEPERKK